MKKLNVLILGGGGREHAIAWKLNQSEWMGGLFVAPGNGGTGFIATNLDIRETDFPAVKSAVIENAIDLIIVGPEAPLVKGVREFIESDVETENVRIVGPGRRGAKLEGSKAFSKEFMVKHGIPTAKYGQFTAKEIDKAKAFLHTMKPPYVLKADGLAGGKGVLILEDIVSAKAGLDEMLGGKFGAAGEVVVIEEFLDGIELSSFVLTDGKSHINLPSAKDYKRIGEGDTGLNTGGMGSISPVPFADDEFLQRVDERIVKPTIEGLKKDGIDYNGFLFIGLMNVGGDPFVIEYNVRMGDPETESIMPRIESDFLEVLWKCGGGELEGSTISISTQAVASLMMVSGGYPESYEKGKEIFGLTSITEALIFHAGTKMIYPSIETSGGRVLTVTSYGDSIKAALDTSYREANKISFDKMYYRKDLGFDLKS
ncbi:MAG: phosphoribosylamine--glycine ligase [Flavobacteriales bacterium]|nr:phosphoribosylamine--glycine ligase [Flavobacteriales bacterium]